MAPLGKTNLLRFQALIAIVVSLILVQLGKAKNGKALATWFANDSSGLFPLVHRRLRTALHTWLVDKIEANKKRDIPKEIDEEFARGCQQQFSDQANGNLDTSWSCYYDFLLNVCGVKEVEPLKGLLDLAKVCGWWTPLRWVAILQHRPAQLALRQRGAPCSLIELMPNSSTPLPFSAIWHSDESLSYVDRWRRWCAIRLMNSL